MVIEIDFTFFRRNKIGKGLTKKNYDYLNNSTNFSRGSLSKLRKHLEYTYVFYNPDPKLFVLQISWFKTNTIFNKWKLLTDWVQFVLLNTGFTWNHWLCLLVHLHKYICTRSNMCVRSSVWFGTHSGKDFWKDGRHRYSNFHCIIFLIQKKKPHSIYLCKY